MSEVIIIPDGWEKTTLGENLKEIAMGPFGSNLKVDMFTEDGVPIIKGGNLSGYFVDGDFSFVSEEKADSLRKAVAYPNDLIITHRGTLGQVSLVPEGKYNRYVTSQSQLRLCPNRDKIHYRYLLYFFKSNLGQYELLKNTSQVGVPAISTPTKSIKEIEFTIPKDVKEQKSIAAILTAFDDKIELLQAQNKTLEETAQTIFGEWFGKYDVEGELPQGWRVGKLSDFNAVIADFVANGSFASLKENVTLYDYEEYALFMRNTDLKSGFTQKTYVDKRAYDFLSKTKLFGGEIIISNVGDVGSVHFCPYFDIPMTLGNNVIMLQSEFQYYFYTMYNSKIGQHLISSITGGSAQPKFNKTDFRNMGMIIPSKDILQKFENIASKLYMKILKNKEQIQTLTKTRAELLPQLMSGEVRVKM